MPEHTPLRASRQARKGWRVHIEGPRWSVHAWLRWMRARKRGLSVEGIRWRAPAHTVGTPTRTFIKTQTDADTGTDTGTDTDTDTHTHTQT